MKLKFSILFIAICFSSVVEAQVLRTYKLTTGFSSGFPVSNSVDELVFASDTLWGGFSGGLGWTNDAGAHWEHLTGDPLKPTGISGIAIAGDLVVASGATTTKQDNESLQTGDGFFRSTDRGATWTSFSQPLDQGTADTLTYGINKIVALNVTTAVNNVTFDIAIGAGAIWTANFAGMLRTSVDSGATWTRVILPPDGLDAIKPSDSLDFDLAPTGGRLNLRGNLNHRVFSVLVEADTAIWVGTAGGINRSSDGGVSWRKFSHQNQGLGISGNFVVALRHQVWRGVHTVWAATVNAEAEDEVKGVSWTTNNGSTWTKALPGVFAHNFAFQDSIVYAATDNGLYRSSDAGSSWQRNGTIADLTTGQRFASQEIITVAVRGDSVFVGGPEGFAWSIDSPAEPFGSTWHIARTYVPVPPSTTYAYPVPFSPDDEVVRLHYATPAGPGVDVTLRVFDFRMMPVRTVLAQASRTGGTQYDEIWDGRTDDGQRAANGAYFYRLEMSGQDPVWGKILVVQ